MVTSRVLLACLPLAFGACQRVPPCEEGKRYFLGKETNMVLTDKGMNGNLFDVRGYDPVTGRAVRYHNTHGLYIFIRDSAQVGDTLVKKRSETRFVLKKARVNLVFEL